MESLESGEMSNMEKSNEYESAFAERVEDVEEERFGDKTTSAMVGRIEDALDGSGFVGGIIFGNQRIGKSSYALQVMKEIYGSWDKAIEHTHFELDDVLDALSGSLDVGEEIPVLLWDDGGVHASKHLFWSDRKKTQLLQSLLDTCGYHLGCLLITTPSPNNLLKCLRDYEFYRVKITRKNEYWGRNALGYRNIMLPSGASFIKKVFQDSFSCKLPDGVHGEYQDMRSKYTKEAVRHLKEYVREEEN